MECCDNAQGTRYLGRYFKLARWKELIGCLVYLVGIFLFPMLTGLSKLGTLPPYIVPVSVASLLVYNLVANYGF